MKKVFFSLLLSATTLVASAQNLWKVDKAHAQVKFGITHLGISTVSGAFTDFDASFTYSKSDYTDLSFSFTAKTGSINTGIAQRDDHLRSADFFDAAQNPEITFVTKGVKKLKKDKFQLSGDLTLHGVTKTVKLEVWNRGTITNPMSQKPTTGFQVTGKIKRADFNLGNNFPAPMLSEEVTIIADGEFPKE
jgi:polyisoprenoid-binding protein YceI